LPPLKRGLRSGAFRVAHPKAGDDKPLDLGHPLFEGFEVRQTVGRGKDDMARTGLYVASRTLRNVDPLRSPAQHACTPVGKQNGRD
jgi:hypothetical protein